MSPDVFDGRRSKRGPAHSMARRVEGSWEPQARPARPMGVLRNPPMRAVHAVDYLALPEPELVAFARAGDHEAFRAIMTRCNQRLFRIARAVVRDEGEAEDVLQEAYARAFAAIASFRGESGVATWLTRIVLNEAHGRLRRRKPTVDLDELEAAQA